MDYYDGYHDTAPATPEDWMERVTDFIFSRAVIKAPQRDFDIPILTDDEAELVKCAAFMTDGDDDQDSWESWMELWSSIAAQPSQPVNTLGDKWAMMTHDERLLHFCYTEAVTNSELFDQVTQRLGYALTGFPLTAAASGEGTTS